MVLLKLILAHLIGDFVLQPISWIDDKRKNTWKSIYLYVHGFIHFALILILLGDPGYWLLAFVISITHIVIDFTKVNLQTEESKIGWFYLDQMLHFLVIIGLGLWMAGFSVTFADGNEAFFWILATGILMVTRPAMFMIIQFMQLWPNALDKVQMEKFKSLKEWLNNTERVLIFGSILLKWYYVTVFVMLIKSIFSYIELKRYQNREFKNYVVIKTALSFLIAIFTGFLTEWFLIVAEAN